MVFLHTTQILPKMEKLTLEEKATNHDTWRHINRVQQLLSILIKDLMDRSIIHDQSKLESPEVELFTEFTDKLSKCTYGSEEYFDNLEKMKPAIKHHHANNRHHPEFFKSGIKDMTLVDLLEMIADWKAASERHGDGNIRKSIEINSKRFDIPVELVTILENTVRKYF